MIANSTVFFVAFGVFGVAILGMAIGVLLARKPLKGSCGGLNQLQDHVGGPPLCEVCGGDPKKKPSDCRAFDDLPSMAKHGQSSSAPASEPSS